MTKASLLQKHGLEATGILANVSKAAGMGSVSELLSRNPNAKALSMAAADPVKQKVPYMSYVHSKCTCASLHMCSFVCSS